MTEKTKHDWMIAPYGYDPADYCRHCHASNYDTRTEYCEDYYEEKQVKLERAEKRHAPTEAAWNKARQVLTKEEWDLMDLKTLHGREYRVIDRI